ncbi:MAG TPA: hypothetical protein GX000_08685, partial [Actinomyces sp.]|nr:hypothetical protein [Actinomyces sp.]
EGASEQCQFMLDHDNVKQFNRWDEKDTEEWSNKVLDGLVEAWITEAEANGLADARGYYETYKELVQDVTQEDLDKDPVIACVNEFYDQGRNER